MTEISKENNVVSEENKKMFIRLNAEQEQLNSKKNALNAFIGTNMFEKLSKHAKDLLVLQYKSMSEYSSILTMRIELFKKENN